MAAKDFWTKISSIDYRYIYGIMTVLVFIPLIFPIGTPIPIGDNVKNYAKVIDELEPGSTVLLLFSGYATMLPDVEPIYLTTWKMLLSADVKFMVILTHVDCPIVITNHFTALSPEQNYGKTYGEDYVFFPYIDVTEAVHVSLTENLYSVYNRDLYDTPLSSLPIMEGVSNLSNVDLVVAMSPEIIVRRYSVPFGIKIVCWGTATGLLPFVPPYYDPNTGPVYGYVGGASQGAELELVSGFLGDGVRYNDAKNLAVIGLVSVVLVANISDNLRKKGDED